MAYEVLERITNELTEVGHSVTSYSELGLDFDEIAVSRLREVVEGDTFDAEAAELTTDIDTNKMIIARGADTLRLGTAFVRPVMETLFADSPKALGKWALYAVNRYDEEGSRFAPHKDSVGGTVVVATLVGRRSMDIYRRYPDQREDRPETFREIEHTVELGPGSIMIIDGYLDPPHAVRCLEALSISAVVDIPDLLRPRATWQPRSL
jgi:hypothetical protein